MEKPSEDTGPGQVPYMMNVLLVVITEANFSQTNAEQDVESQLSDGNLSKITREKLNDISFLLVIEDLVYSN